MGVDADASPQLLPLPPRVLLLVILEVLAALDRPPPLLVVAVPLDRLADCVFKFMARRPAELALDLARIDSRFRGSVVDAT